MSDKSDIGASSMKKKLIMLGVIGLIALGCLYLGLREVQPNKPLPLLSSNDATYPQRLVRPYSPVLGPESAPVTLVEFFDPACEACRAFYPVVKDLLKQHPQDVRLVMRYAAFHPGSEKIVRLLESARRQGKFWEVLEALFLTQPLWANHSRPNLDAAYQSARQAGLDVERALAEGATSEMDDLLQQEMQDLIDLKIEKTPTFFVNGEGLPTFDAAELSALVARKVAESKHK